jgi:hypothetical protein
MLAGLSVVCVVVGALIALSADRHPQHRSFIETVAGIVLISGFGLLGYRLGCVLGSPY